MKKGIVFLAALLLVLGGVTSALAITADTTHKGSLLIFPKIDVSTSNKGYTDTFIFISNDGPSAVDIKCYWVRGDVQAAPVYQDFTDFQFNLSKYEAFEFSATYGYPGTYYTNQVPGWPFSGFRKGFLACFTVDNSGATATNWNYLYGNAWVIDYCHDVAYSYPAWSFRAVNAATGATPTPITLPAGTPVSGSTDAGLVLPLDGVTYTSCPAQLAFNFPAEYSVPTRFPFAGFNDLTIVPCKQDLRQDHGLTTTKLQFDVWNTFETKFTNAYACSNCWFDRFLTDSAIHYNGAFSAGQIGVLEFARFRVTAVQSTQCPGSAPAGIIGLLTTYWPVFQVESDGAAASSQSYSVGAAAFTQNGFAPTIDGPAGFILWNPAGPDLPGKAVGVKKPASVR